jgi:MerR family transcriptional regulator, copper efflux regulator
MLIGELAKATGTTKDTIRHYHQQGLLIVSQRAAGSRTYNDYPYENIDRIDMIKYGKTMGFTLSEMNSLQEAYYSGELSTPEQIQILNDKLSLIEQKIHGLNQIRTSIHNKLSILKDRD